MLFTNPKIILITSKLQNFASTKFNLNEKKRNILFSQKEGSKQHQKPNKFIMKIFVISLIQRSKEFLASFNNPKLTYPVFKKYKSLI